MAQVLRFESTDQRITYTPNWTIMPNSGVGQNGTYSLASTINAGFFFLFRGTSVRFYGRLGGGGGNLSFRFDVNTTTVSLNGTNFNDGPTVVWSAVNLADGDHQLWLWVNSLAQNGSVAVDYFVVENSSGKGFDLLSAGPNATNVPKEAIIVDNSDPDVVSTWSSNIDIQYYRSNYVDTSLSDISLSYSFDGVAIWYYSSIAPWNGFYTVSIDGLEPERSSAKTDGGFLTQQMLWSKTNLTPGRHTFTLKQDDVDGAFTGLDFFRVLQSENASALPSSTPTSTGAATPESKSNPLPLAVGLTLGLLFAVLLVLGTFYLRRRKRRNLELRRRKNATPLHDIPPKKGDQLSGVPQESKGLLNEHDQT